MEWKAMSTESLSFCMVTTFYPPYHFGGEAMYLYRLSNELARRGHRVTVVHCVNSYELLTTAEPRGEFPHHENVTVRPLRSKGGALSPLVTYLSGRPGLKAAALNEIFAEQEFDVVHYHLVTLFGPGVLEYGSGIKLYTTHDHWLVCPMYDLWRYNRELCDEPKCFSCQLSFRRPPQLWRYTSLLERELSHVDLFLSPSRSTIEQHRRRGFTYPMRQLPYFLPEAEASLPSDPAPTGRPYFLFVGRLVRLKGAHTLIEAFREYRGADLLIAGDGGQEAALRKQAEGLEHVRFLGRVHPDRLRGLYAGARAVLIPSMVYETFGFITLEALAQRTPLIAHDLGAVAEVVHDSGGGFTYRTQAELIEALTVLGRDTNLRNELGERGHRAYLERWTEDPHLEAYMAIIAEARELRRKGSEHRKRETTSVRGAR
jgi:glycosyltransferase involved in cell wall biosynthesis